METLCDAQFHLFPYYVRIFRVFMLPVGPLLFQQFLFQIQKHVRRADTRQYCIAVRRPARMLGYFVILRSAKFK